MDICINLKTGCYNRKNGDEIFIDLPDRQPKKTVEDLVLLALKTAAHAE